MPWSVSKKTTQHTVSYLYTPIIAIVLFMLAMFGILWSLSNQEKQQSELSFFREVAYAAQRIQVNFDENEEELLVLSKSMPSILGQNTNSDFYRNASIVLNNHREILEMIAVGKNLKKSLIFPSVSNDLWNKDPEVKEKLQQSFQKTLSQALATGHGQYSSLLQIHPKSENLKIETNRSVVFWYIQPAEKFSEQTNNIAVLYSIPLIIDKIIPPDILSRHRFSILDQSNEVVYSLNDRNLAKNHSTTQIRLTKFPDDLSLQGESYPLPTNLTYQMLMWIVGALCAYVIWSFWSIWRQMKFRQDIQQNLIQETSFRKAIEDSMPIGLRVHDPDGRITYVNPAFCRMVEWSAEELIGLRPPFPFWTDAEEISNNLKKLNLVFKDGIQPMNGIEASVTSRSGKQIAVRNFVSPMVNQKNKQTGWINTLVDISEPKRIREELAIAQQRFITVLEGLTAGICVVSPKTGELLFTNNLYREMFKNFPDAHHALIGSESMSENQLQMDQDGTDGFAGLPSSVLTPIIGESQEIQIPELPNWFEVTRRFIPWTDGHLAKLLITIDITEKHQARENLRLQEERLQFSSRLTTMGEMASSIAHELNQPLAAINNYCSGVINRLRAKKDEQIDQEIIPALEKISNQSLRAGSIIQGIRNFVKRSSPQRETCHISKIVFQSLNLAQIEANRQGLLIEDKIEADLPECFVDPVMIEQVIINLLKNAIDSMRMTYPRSRRGLVPPIEIIADLDNHLQPPMLRIRIIDTGSGIDEAVIQQIYEPFFSTKEEGMGMGLNICRSIIESHEGRLFGENNPKTQAQKEKEIATGATIYTGCTFTILLPLEHYIDTNTKTI